MRSRHWPSAIVTAAFAVVAQAQTIITPTPACAVPPPPYSEKTGHGYALYPTPSPMTYPTSSDQYSVQYSLDGGTWTDAMVYISDYGGSNSSPYLSYSGYLKPTGPTSYGTSMSFVSIPAGKGVHVQLRVTKLENGPFLSGDNVSVRPSSKPIVTSLASDGTVLISTKTGEKFDGEQFILWWDRLTAVGLSGATQGLAFFLDPIYTPPKGKKVKIITSPSDLDPTGLAGYETLVFEGFVAIGNSGAEAFVVPENILNIYLSEGSWVQGKLVFTELTPSPRRRVYGPGVLDVSRFEYDLRQCSNTTEYASQGYPALYAVDSKGAKAPLDNFHLNGIIISDNNFYATGSLTSSTVNNVKIIAWNGNNDGLEFGDDTTATNVFVRSGDDSLKMWGCNDHVTNATVWQNYNGGVVNLGWFLNSPGDFGTIDRLYVVKTDWFTPTSPTFKADQADAVAHQNNAVIASMMVPGTAFGTVSTPVYQNIYIEDPPWVLLSLKIVTPRTSNPPLNSKVNLLSSSTIKLNLLNVYTPPSHEDNSIGFDHLPPGFTFFTQTFPASLYPQGYTLAGSMNISLTNVVVGGTILTSANALSVGRVQTKGSSVAITY